MDIVVKAETSFEQPEDAAEGYQMAPVDSDMVAARMKALLGAGGVPRLRGMSEKQRQSELEMLVTQLTGTVPEVSKGY